MAESPPPPPWPAAAPANPQPAAGNRSSSWDALQGAQPVPLHIKDAAAVYGSKYAIVEKNWMPFVYNGQLFVTYSLAPKHRTYLLHPDGTAEPKYESDSGECGALSSITPPPPSPPSMWQSLTWTGYDLLRARSCVGLCLMCQCQEQCSL